MNKQINFILVYYLIVLMLSIQIKVSEVIRCILIIKVS